jgi:hypothetical protein
MQEKTTPFIDKASFPTLPKEPPKPKPIFEEKKEE